MKQKRLQVTDEKAPNDSWAWDGLDAWTVELSEGNLVVLCVGQDVFFLTHDYQQPAYMDEIQRRQSVGKPTKGSWDDVEHLAELLARLQRKRPDGKFVPASVVLTQGATDSIGRLGKRFPKMTMAEILQEALDGWDGITEANEARSPQD